MKSRLNITVDNVLLEEAKFYAVKHKTSLSQLVEKYFKTLIQSPRKENILEYMAKLPTRKKVTIEGDPRKVYYERRRKKYGF